MLLLANGTLLIGCEDGDSHILKEPPPYKPPAVASILHSSAPVWDFSVANLQQLPQSQVNILHTLLYSCFKGRVAIGLFRTSHDPHLLA